MSEEKINEFNSYYSHDVSTASSFEIYGRYSAKDIEDIIKHPMENNEQLRQISRMLYSSNGLTRNTIDYMTSIPTLDCVITSYEKDKKTKAQREIVQFVLDKIKHKEIIRDALHKSMIDGVCFYYFETKGRKLSKVKSISKYDAENIAEINSAKSEMSKINVSIISLPTDYCRIVGIKNNSYVISFDLEYFNARGNETAESKLRKYPKEIRDGYNAWKNGTGKQMLILDNTKTIVHKISANKDEPWGRPLVLAAIPDILYSDYFTDTKRNVLDNINNQVIYETFPQGKEAGTSALTGEQQKAQHDTVKNAITSKNNRGGISFFSVAAGTKLDSMNVNTDIFDSKNESDLDTKIGTALGFAASLLNASSKSSYSAQQTNLELVTSQIFQWISEIANELNKVINYNILGNSFVAVKVNYLPITHINKKEMISNAKDLYLQGKGSLILWAACCGLPADVFTSMVEYEIEQDYENKYPVHRTSYTQPADDTSDNKGGRPTLDDPTNENTIKSRTNNSNNTIKPSTK